MTIFKKKKIGKTIGAKPRYRPTVEVKRRRPRSKKLKKNPEKKLLKSKTELKRRKKIIRPLILIGVGIILYGATYFFFISGTFTITKIEFDHDEITVEDENPILNYLQNFKGENILLIDTDEEEIYLKESYPEYKTIEIKKAPLHTLVLEIELYEITANLIAKREGVSNKFIISENGLVTDENTEDPSLPYIYIETPETIIKGQIAIDQITLEFILEAITDFENKFGMQILDVTYYKTAREAHLHTESYFDVWLDTQLTVDEQLNKLKQALPSLNIYEEDLEYIDLRISGQSGDKVIYMPN